MTTGHCKSSLGSFDELQNSAQAAVDPQTKKKKKVKEVDLYSAFIEVPYTQGT